MNKQKQNISGLSILEALVSTVIVGIGFVAILQMTNFSVQSIDNSGDRTKANFLTQVILFSHHCMKQNIQFLNILI